MEPRRRSARRACPKSRSWTCAGSSRSRCSPTTRRRTARSASTRRSWSRAPSYRFCESNDEETRALGMELINRLPRLRVPEELFRLTGKPRPQGAGVRDPRAVGRVPRPRADARLEAAAAAEADGRGEGEEGRGEAARRTAARASRTGPRSGRPASRRWRSSCAGCCSRFRRGGPRSRATRWRTATPGVDPNAKKPEKVGVREAAAGPAGEARPGRSDARPGAGGQGVRGGMLPLLDEFMLSRGRASGPRASSPSPASGTSTPS